jgi:hypothetical protein
MSSRSPPRRAKALKGRAAAIRLATLTRRTCRRTIASCGYIRVAPECGATLVAHLTKSDTVYVDDCLGHARGYTKLTYEPEVGQDVIGDVRHQVR